MLYEQTSEQSGTVQPLFLEFAQRLMVDHAEEVAIALRRCSNTSRRSSKTLPTPACSVPDALGASRKW